ncbi:sensor histidine kinase [Flaviaesturariibacter flavus]|nr:HAMP domain-containing sensor histidine kinase [Flaviaesturariibacter flavus]
MKLLEKWRRVTVGVTIGIFLVASVALYISLHFILLQQIDDDLRIEEKEIQIYVEKHGRLPETISVEDQLIAFSAVAAPGRRHFETRDIPEPGASEPEPSRCLVFFVKDRKGWYQVTVSKSIEQTNDLIGSMFTIGLVTIVAILFVSMLINRWAVKRLWRPFYTAIRSVREHKLSEGAPLQLPATQIEEFRMLNESLQAFASHARLEYLSLKTFSENATHELQTPIAVIRSKLDLLQQEHQLSEPGVQALQAAFNSLQRLDRLNQSLLLLARIENKQFADTEVIDLTFLLEEKLAEFQELFSQQEMRFVTELAPVRITMNLPLCHVLLNNLLSNALRHGIPGGTVRIFLSDDLLKIGNGSNSGALEESALFRRFHAATSDAASTGLGLALVQEICRVSGFTAGYQYAENNHWFTIQLKRTQIL